MEKIKYRQYYYGGEYTEEVLTFPECRICEICIENIAFKVNDNEYTKDYIIFSKEPIESLECNKLNDDLYFYRLTAVYITSNIALDQFPKAENIYIIKYPVNSIKIANISKILEFTPRGAKIATVYFRNLIREDIEVDAMDVDYMLYRDLEFAKIANDCKELFIDRAKEIYNLVING